MDDPTILSMFQNLQSSLATHAQSNNERFAFLEQRISNLTSGVSTMATGQSDGVSITNAAPSSDPTAAMMMAAMSGKNAGNDGFLGGGGLLGGLLLGSLLRNGNGGLFGGGNGGGDMAAVTQPQANMSIMSALGDLKQAVAVGTAQMETSQALQSSTIQSQLSSVAAATVAQVAGVKDAVNSNTVALMQMVNGVNQNISNDGDKTRALITAQYEQTLNRQLSDANAAIIELRSQATTAAAARATEVTVIQNVNQQQQQQQQAILLDRVNQVLASHQYLQQGIVNLGTMSDSAGQQTANNTRVN